jgi:hypothetical protein
LRQSRTTKGIRHENVGPVVNGDVLLCKLDGLPDMSIRIV